MGGATRFELSWFNDAALLAVSRARPDHTGELLVVDAAGRQQAVSWTFPGFTTPLRACSVSPDDTKLAVVTSTELIVLHTADCGVHMQGFLAGPHLQHTCMHWSPCNGFIVVANRRPLETRFVVLMLWVADVRLREVTHAVREFNFNCSGVWGWTRAHPSAPIPLLLLTEHPSDSTQTCHGLHCLQLPQLPRNPPGGAASGEEPLSERPFIYSTQGLALIDYVSTFDTLSGYHLPLPFTRLAQSPDGTYIAVLSGLGLAAWHIQVLKAASGVIIAEWRSAFGPVERGVDASWALVWSRDGRRLSVVVHAREPYCGSYLLALTGETVLLH